MRKKKNNMPLTALWVSLGSVVFYYNFLPLVETLVNYLQSCLAEKTMAKNWAVTSWQKEVEALNSTEPENKVNAIGFTIPDDTVDEEEGY